jgi:hypothetical protein
MQRSCSLLTVGSRVHKRFFISLATIKPPVLRLSERKKTTTLNRSLWTGRQTAVVTTAAVPGRRKVQRSRSHGWKNEWRDRRKREDRSPVRGGGREAPSWGRGRRRNALKKHRQPCGRYLDMGDGHSARTPPANFINSCRRSVRPAATLSSD